jgi:hypothetical protein
MKVKEDRNFLGSQVSQVIIYSSVDGTPKIEVRLDGDSAWLSQKQLAELFDTTKQNIGQHVSKILEDGELQAKAVVKKIFTTASDGKDYKTEHYNLDMIISVGYRVNSKVATSFRQWATLRLNEYITQGFTINDEFLKNNGGGAYWHKLLARIRDIRSSEKVLYRQVLDIYATSTDYDPKSLNSIEFFKIVQNKLHYATHRQTAAEVIHSRADSDKEFMGLTVFAGDLPVLEEVRIAKNYLTVEELERLNRFVSAYFDLAEIRAIEKQAMSMVDHINALDKLMNDYGKGVLDGAGSISHEQAMKKAENEYKIYQAKTLSTPERAYIDSLKLIEKAVKGFK